MAHYITSHGQVAKGKYHHGNPALPLGDLTLTDLGREQARLLGEHLKSLEFHGLIVCSPVSHAIQTAAIVAEITEARVLPYGPMHERFPDEESLRDYCGMTLEQLRSCCPAILPDAELEYPWWPAAPEDEAAVTLRVARAYQYIAAMYPQEDLLFLGHTATCDALVRLFELKPKKNTLQYNCALTTLNPTVLRFVPDVYNTWFLPYAKTTLNTKSREELDLAYFAAPHTEEIPLPDLSEFTGERVLHIGDTESWEYPCFRHLFELVKPDVILHTGDMADEVKIGRHPEYLYEYVTKITVLLDMMKQTGARLVIVPGNHDVPEEIARIAPEAEIYPPLSEVILSGVPCRVGHQVRSMVFDRKYCLYGHGMAGEVWRYGFNIPGGHCRFNVAFGTFIYDLANDRFCRLSRPIKTIPEE